MQLIDRYLFRQMLGPTVIAAFALTAVAILTESLSALDILVDQRQSLLVFIKVVFLAMPQLIAMILPVAVLLGSLVAFNRLHTEQEIVICFSGGMSRWRIAAPALQVAGVGALICLVLTLWVQPLCYRALRQTLEGVKTNLAATLINPGKFSHPAPGVTVYAQSIDDDGAIQNLFIDHDAGHGRDNTVTAREGRLEIRGGVPMLVMHRGATQEFSKSGILNFLSFDEYILDLRPLMPPDRPLLFKLSDRYLHELFFPAGLNAWEQSNQRKMLAEGHSRIAAPLYNITFVLMGVAAVVGGAFNRRGYGARIAVVAVAALVTRTLGFGAQAVAAAGAPLNILQYLTPIVAALIALAILFARRHETRRMITGAPT